MGTKSRRAPIRRVLLALALGVGGLAGIVPGQEGHGQAFNPGFTPGTGVGGTVPGPIRGAHPPVGFNYSPNNGAGLAPNLGNAPGYGYGTGSNYGPGYGYGYGTGSNYAPGYGNGYGYGFNNGVYGGNFYGGNVAAAPFAVPGYAGAGYVGLPSYGVTYGQNVTDFGVANYGSYSRQYGAFGFPAYRSYGYGRGFNGVFGGLRRW